MTSPVARIARQVTEDGEIYIVRKAKYFFGRGVGVANIGKRLVL